MSLSKLLSIALLSTNRLAGLQTYLCPSNRELLQKLLGIMTEKTDDSSTTCTQFTPETSEPTILGEPWDGRRYAVPWPGNKYHIFMNETDRVICTHHGGDVYVYDINQDVNKQYTWLCVEKNGYFGFVNTDTGRYIGHNDRGVLRADAWHLEAWELMTVRKHPEGGYELLMPHWWHTLKKVSVLSDSDNVLLTQHGTTLWQFVKAD